MAACSDHRLGRGMIDPRELSGLEIFDGVDLATVMPVLTRCSMVDLEPGEVLLSLGQENATLFVLVEGTLSVHLQSPDEEPLTAIQPGECVGEMSVVSREPVTAFVVAREPSRVLAVPHSQVWELLDTNYLVARNLLVILSLRVRLSNNAVLDAEDRREMFEKHARSDKLTGLYNRRHLDEGLERMSRCICEDNGGFSFMILDLDHFKRFNDTYGHLGGDCVLASLGRVLRETMREQDIITRYGGEEFAVILPELGMDAAAEIAERLRMAVSEAVMTGCEGEPLPSVTISVGVTEAEQGQDPSSVIAAADAALYRAKENGRNRVCRSDRED